MPLWNTAVTSQAHASWDSVARSGTAVTTTEELPLTKPTYEAPVLENLSLKATHDVGVGVGVSAGVTLGLGS
ncbi:hypothetical protein GCM10028801_12200 [Nocardioides maradonensis]